MRIKFPHGLGDVSNFARMIPLYIKRGIPVEVAVEESKILPLVAAGATIVNEDTVMHHHWCIQSDRVTLTPSTEDGFSGNKSGENLAYEGLLFQGSSHQDLWKELKASRPSVLSHVTEDNRRSVLDVIYGKKIRGESYILWHSTGNTSRARKSFPDSMHIDFLYSLINKTKSHIIILDWDKRTQWTRNNRIHHSTELFEDLNLQKLACLMQNASLMVGIDSGPLYFSQLTDVPSIMVSFEDMHPCQYIIPSPNTVSISLSKKYARYNPCKRFEFQIIDDHDIIKTVVRMLGPKRYSNTATLAEDCHLQHIVLDKCAGRGDGNALSSIYDRSVSFDVLLNTAKDRFSNPIIVETGCMRAAEDWAGAGMSTALFSRYAQLTGGTFYSYDLNQTNVEFASNWCRQFGPGTKIITSRGNDGIKSHDKIDILYLDSLDSGCEGHQECNLEEFQAAEKALHSNSLVLIDDTPNLEIGKGAKTIAYALERGWKILYAGYQVLLCKI